MPGVQSQFMQGQDRFCEESDKISVGNCEEMAFFLS